MLKLGVIGLNADWDECHSALQKLRHPSQVVAVFDSDAAHAAERARKLRASVMPSITAMAHHPQVQAILLTNADWRGTAVIDLLAQAEKPVFIATLPDSDSAQATRWYAATEQRGVTLMPALPLRFMPATIRLKELIATELGEPIEIVASISVGCDSIATPQQRSVDCDSIATVQQQSATSLRIDRVLLSQLDLIRYLIQRDHSTVTKTTSDGTTETWIEFPARRPSSRSSDVSPQKSSSEIEPCRVRLQHRSNSIAITSEPIRIRCRNGTAIWHDRTTLEWSINGQPSVTEQLTEERHERVILLDHFCRRAVGGLIPVADFNDIHRAANLGVALQQ